MFMGCGSGRYVYIPAMQRSALYSNRLGSLFQIQTMDGTHSAIRAGHVIQRHAVPGDAHSAVEHSYGIAPELPFDMVHWGLRDRIITKNNLHSNIKICYQQREN